jgi:hypothetical protein
MQTGDTFLKNLLNALLPNRAAPVLARVEKAHEGPGKTKYSVDVRVLTVGTLEDTDQVIAEVPISPIWAAKKMRGIYAIPPEGQVVIVEFLCWNPAYPYIAGIWSDEYEADEFTKDQFVISDGDGMKIIIDAAEKTITIDNGKKGVVKLEEKKITVDNGAKSIVTLEEEKVTADNGKMQVVLNGDKCAIKNGSKSLFTIIDTHFKNIIGMKTMGAPPQHVVSPDTIAAFQQDKADLAALLEA